ncbi:Uncharacterised protein [Candidatus Bilamarchaeum dharawalense]|uniref:Nucleotidyl transferase AbiEii toxin, Type IV TA system n=1 Tax=Candidatus Bilamarchaeum dharawalense TaxID=2885759 RepID=A0A5E4LSH8_9ARCH|nr:Uncharacterised protein [Candidatus Bilamarchaeum dharawalense]
MNSHSLRTPTTVNQIVKSRIEALAPLTDGEILKRIDRNPRLYEYVLRDGVDIGRLARFISMIEEREKKNPGSFFPVLDLFCVSPKVAERQGELIVMGGWNSFLFLFASYGPSAIDKWRGSHDVDLLTRERSTPKILGRILEEDGHTILPEPSIAHDAKYSGFLEYGSPGKSSQMDLYVPIARGNVLGISIEDLFIPLDSMKPIQIEYLGVSLTDPKVYTIMKASAARRRDHEDIVETFAAIKILREAGADILEVQELLEGLAPEIKLALYRMNVEFGVKPTAGLGRTDELVDRETKVRICQEIEMTLIRSIPPKERIVPYF